MTVDELRKKLEGVAGSVEVVIPNAFAKSFWPGFCEATDAKLHNFMRSKDGEYEPVAGASNVTAFAIQ